MATTDLNPGRRSSDVGVEGQASPPSEVQIELLKALYKVIAPLVQAELPSSKGLDNVPMGREAEDLLAALQKYISTLIRDGTKTRVVNLGETPEMENESKTEGVDGQLDLSTTPPENSKNSLERLSDTTGTVVLRNVLSHDQYQIQLKEALMNLRKRVLNNLPIRLLRFERSDSAHSKLEISLLDRTEVYSYLERKFLGDLGTSREEAPSSDIFSLDSSFDSINKYAILSHTWLQSAPEITYDDWRDGNFDLRHEGYRKLVNFCRVAHDDYGLNLGWMDTVCIDKTSSSELDESIRSMYKWYEKAEICIIHLADTSSISNMTNDRWFSRGWTLQELLAPRSSKFYGRDWKRLIGSGYSSDKNDADTQEMIYQATGIMPRDLEQPISASISHKMKWAAKRQVTRDEDTVYSLMGLFGVSMSIAYGEGAGRAFSRLVNKILNGTHGFDSRIMDLFNFGEGTRNPYEDHISRLLPVNPQAYLDSSDYSFSTGPLIEPLTSTHLGLRIPVLVLPAAPGRLSAGKYTPLGDYFANPINYTIAHTDYMSNDTPTCLNISAKKVAFNWLGEDARCIVAVLNCSAAPEDGSVLIPLKCLAAGYIHTNKTLWVSTTTNIIDKMFPPVTDRIKLQALP